MFKLIAKAQANAKANVSMPRHALVQLAYYVWGRTVKGVLTLSKYLRTQLGFE